VPLEGSGEKRSGRGGGAKQSEIIGCQYWETVWIEVHVGMPFQIGGRHGQGWCLVSHFKLFKSSHMIHKSMNITYLKGQG
jgi:hypothetical protein